MGQKILYLFDHGDWQSRMPVALAARAAGYAVTIGLIGGDAGAAERVPAGFGAAFVSVPEGRFRGASLLKMTSQIRALIAREKPDLVHAVTLKYGFVTGLAALPDRRLRKVYTLAGLGYLFHGEGKAKLIRALLAPLLKTTFKAPGTQMIFQNPDDMRMMIDTGFARAQDCTLIRGSGVDLRAFFATPESESTAPLVLMPTRLVHEKGVQVFVEAARILKAKGSAARFQIAGGETKHNPRAISAADMHAMTKDGAAQWIGRAENMPALLQKAALIVYPSYYGEGIPRVLIEACAAGRPIITTDHTGCREAVDAGVNGLLVPVKDAKATAAAIEELLGDAARRKDMGAASRAKAEAEFDIKLVADKTLAVYKANSA